MKIIIKAITVIFCISSLFGCDGNYRNIDVKGIVKSSGDKKPITNAEVLVKCWVYSIENWESNTVEQTVKSDENGKFEVHFERGEAIDVIVIAKNFKTKEESRTLKRNKINIDVYLDAE